MFIAENNIRNEKKKIHSNYSSGCYKWAIFDNMLCICQKQHKKCITCKANTRENLYLLMLLLVDRLTRINITITFRWIPFAQVFFLFVLIRLLYLSLSLSLTLKSDSFFFQFTPNSVISLAIHTVASKAICWSIRFRYTQFCSKPRVICIAF